MTGPSRTVKLSVKLYEQLTTIARDRETSIRGALLMVLGPGITGSGLVKSRDRAFYWRGLWRTHEPGGGL